MSEQLPTPRKPTGTLRKGWTTGACAAGAALAAYRALVSGAFKDCVTIHLPRDVTPCFTLSRHDFGDGFARAGIIKDAGDDPDVTHGLEIIAEVRLSAAHSGVSFFAGEGVGTVTLAGLVLAPGEPAINPGPRKQICDALQSVNGTLPDVQVTISIPGGLEASHKTMNARLGIIGGLSVLGTTGVVVPYSCSSWIHSIQRGIDVARAQGFKHVLAATGRTSERAANSQLSLPEEALIDMGDFAGGLLKYVRCHPIQRLTVAGGFAKLTKLAQGCMDLHSSRSRVDFEKLAALLEQLGADQLTVEAARHANTAMQVLQLADSNAPRLAQLVARQAREVALATLAGGTDIEVWVYDRQGQRIAVAS
ncbi:MAG: cobalt-precorrin-5B (C(1))-methyltransferase [Magnetovibrio sp.]|nr:cobalt-precorrin-5B (C(1))-methyltransferase [Magnetovibrio sp.]